MRAILKTIAVLAVTMFTSCAKDLTNNAVSPIESETTTVTVGFNETKTYVGDLIDGVRKVYWSEGDQIAINGNASTTIAISENQRFAEFGFTCILDYPYSVLYPAADYVDDAHINLPSVQEAADGTFATNCAPMACVAEEGDALSLHHLASVVRLQVKLPAESAHAEHNLAKVEFRGKAGEQVSGKFAIDYATATLTPTSTAAADQVVVTKVGKTLSAEEATDIFVVVPAREYAQGFTVRLTDKNGHYMDISAGTITLIKGDIKAMPLFEFVPTGTITGVNIASAQEWNEFVADYNAGNYAEIENFTVNITNDLVFEGTTSKAFAQIGTFSGTIDGGEFSIKGLKDSNNSVVNILNEGAIVKNLNIDSSSNFKFTTYWYNDGVFVRENNGTLINCTNNADIAIVDANRNHEFRIGGLVGRNYSKGSVNECANNGNLTIDSGAKFQGNSFHFGGIVAYNQGTVSNTANNGVLTLAGDNASYQYNFIGGIVGQNEGTVSGCTNGAYATITSTLVTNRHFVGGIVGWNKGTCTGNTNNADIDYSPTAFGGKNPWLYVGGVVGGIESGTINSNTNTGSISNSTSKTHGGVGGIVGTINSSATTFELKNNSVASSATISSTATGGNMGVGGLIGNSHDWAGTIDLKGDTGKIECKVEGGTTGSACGLGGVVGLSYKGPKFKNVTNCACVITMRNNANNASAGGIVGRINEATEITDCVYKGNITVTGTSSNTSLVGGIAGYLVKASVVSGCKYYGNIVVETTKSHFGGIIGHDSSGNTISNSSCGGVFAGITVDTDELALQYVSRAGYGIENSASNSTCTNITYWNGN